MLGAVRPQEDLDSKTFWDLLRRKDFSLQYCEGCNKYRFPPYPSCPYCGAYGGTWKSLSKRGVVYSWVVVHRSPVREYQEEVPFVLALVELEEGPRMVGRLVEIDPDQVKDGLSVVAQYSEIDDRLTLVTFEVKIPGPHVARI